MQDRKVKPTEPLVDPEIFDLILQGLAALSSVASLAAAMVQIRSVTRTHQNHEMLRQQTRQLERAFGDLFEDLRAVLRIMRPAYERQHGTSLDKQPPRFGAGVELTSTEINELGPLWHQVSNHFIQVRTTAFQIQQMIQHSTHPSEDNITDNLEDFNKLMNELLFNSKSFEEAFDQLEQLKRRADGYLLQLRGRPN